MRRFDAMHNDDGSVCIFRVSCLSIFAMCMLIYASLNLLGCSGVVADESEDAEVVAQSEKSSADAIADSNHARRLLALKTLNEASAFYRDCGSINEGFEGCVFDFPQSVTTYYDVSANAADDGFAIFLKAKDNSDPQCTFFEANSNGVLHAFDAQSKESAACLK